MTSKLYKAIELQAQELANYYANEIMEPDIAKEFKREIQDLFEAAYTAGKFDGNLESIEDSVRKYREFLA